MSDRPKRKNAGNNIKKFVDIEKLNDHIEQTVIDSAKHANKENGNDIHQIELKNLYEGFVDIKTIYEQTNSHP